MHLEKEIKFEVKTHDGLIQTEFGKLIGEGREKNSYFDFNNNLKKRNASFRVREYCNKTLLTLKEKGRYEDGIKIKPETNIEFSSRFEDALKFFQKLGGKEIAYYEKEDRRTYDSGWYIICLDTIIDNGKTRYFVEIEAPVKTHILQKAKKLGIYAPELEARVMEQSYLEMFARKRR